MTRANSSSPAADECSDNGENTDQPTNRSKRSARNFARAVRRGLKRINRGRERGCGRRWDGAARTQKAVEVEIELEKPRDPVPAGAEIKKICAGHRVRRKKLPRDAPRLGLRCPNLSRHAFVLASRSGQQPIHHVAACFVFVSPPAPCSPSAPQRTPPPRCARCG